MNVPQQRDPRIFLTLFKKLATGSKEVLERFQKAALGKKTLSVLPAWGDVYLLSSLPDFHKAPKLNESFSQLLEKTLASSRTIALSLSLDETCKLETYLRGMIESQSFTLWSLSAVFEFLRGSDCVPDDPAFGHIVGSMRTGINTQARLRSLPLLFSSRSVARPMCLTCPCRPISQLSMCFLRHLRRRSCSPKMSFCLR